MTYEIKDNTFTLFANDKKGVAKRPDYSGDGKINGENVKISGWIKQTKAGKKYLSCMVSTKIKTVTIDEIPESL